MVPFKNFLGGLMYVDESRVDEYLSKGYTRITEEAHTKSEEISEAPVSEEVTEEKPKRKKKR